MSLEMKIPTVGESITEVVVAGWMKQDGDYVEMDEVLCELESDKATFELNAEAAGVLKIKAKEGDTLEIGAVICEIDTDAKPTNGKPELKKEEVTEETKTNAPKPASGDNGLKKTGEIKEMIVPEVGESITEVTLASWTKADGDYVELDEVIAEVDSDKATFELPSRFSSLWFVGRNRFF